MCARVCVCASMLVCLCMPALKALPIPHILAGFCGQLLQEHHLDGACDVLTAAVPGHPAEGKLAARSGVQVSGVGCASCCV